MTTKNEQAVANMQNLMNEKITELTKFVLNKEYDDVRWLNLIATVKASNQVTQSDVMGYHYIALVDLYKNIDELRTQVNNLAALIAEN